MQAPKFAPVALLILIAGVFGTACRATSPPPAPAVSAGTWATVDGRPITQADVDKAYKRADEASQGLSDEEATAAKLTLLENLILQEILVGRAKALTLTVPDSELD